MSVYNNINREVLDKEGYNLSSLYNIYYNTLTDVQKQRLEYNYRTYKANCASRNKEPDNFQDYTLKHIELNVVR